jgi:integrase/recombinase XerD
MTVRSLKKKPKIVASPTDSMRYWIARFVEWLRVRNFSERTAHSREYQLDRFAAWAEIRDIKRPADVTRPILERYMRHLYHRRKEDGRPLSASAQMSAIGSVRAFFRWLNKQNVLLSNPAADLDLPRTERRLPRGVLTVEEAERVIAEPDIRTPMGLRDRAIVEVFYSTGMRRTELAGLELFDIDADRGTVLIRQGKGKKDRMIPIGERALAWVDRYLVDVRPHHAINSAERALFLTATGEAFVPESLTLLVARYVDAAQIGKRGSCHLFRHTAATLMHENGADIRFIQQLLGHASLRTTEIYTQVSIRKLKQVHSETHPGARLNRSKEADPAKKPD